MKESTPTFIQGIYPFTGAGYESATLLDTHMVSPTKRSQLVYLRAGNSSDALVVISLMREGVLMRLFPVGAKGAIHVPLAVVEDIFPGSKLDILVAAPTGATGIVALDFGLVEI